MSNFETEILNYDMAQEVGYYTIGGRLSDNQNVLTSAREEYFPSTKQSYFYRDVVLEPMDENDPSRLYTDTLEYNTGTHIAEIVDRTLIVGRDGDIVTTSGNYNTETGKANLYSRSTVKMRRGNTLTGDTIDYSRDTGIGVAFGRVIVTDSARQSSIEGDYAYYNEIIDTALLSPGVRWLKNIRVAIRFISTEIPSTPIPIRLIRPVSPMLSTM